MTKRKIPPVDTLAYAQRDEMFAEMDGGKLVIYMGSDKVRSTTADKDEVLKILLHLLQHGRRLWGESFVQSFMAYAEKI